MWTRILALVLFVLTVSTSPAYASEAPDTDADARAAALQQLTVDELQQPPAPVSPYRKRIRTAQAFIGAGATVLAIGGFAFGVGAMTFNLSANGLGPLYLGLTGLCAMPVGLALTLGGGIGLSVSIRMAKLVAGGADHELHVAVAPSLVGTSPGLRIAARW